MSLHDKSGRRHIQSIIFCMLPVVLAVGCIVIPIPTGEKPYYDEAIPGLEVGITSKAEATSQLGVPDGSYFQGSELVYIDTVENWKIAYAGEGGFGIDTTHKRHVLLLSFDTETILTGFELGTAGDDFGDCTKNGICLSESGAFMRYADEVSEAEVKEFRVVDGQCSIYLHGPGNKKAYQVSLGGSIPINMFSTRAFIHWIVKPGQQSIVIWPDPAFLDFNCQGGEVVFAHFDYRWTGPSKLQLEKEVTGREHISNHRLVLLPVGSIGLPFPPPVLQSEHDQP
jgi:hypothetical protein